MSKVIAGYDLSKTYADGALYVEALKKVTLEVNPGEMIAVIGASGEGKSTLLQILGALDSPTSGRVLVKDHEITSMTAKEQGIIRNKYLGFVYQFHHLLPEFDALENVCMPLLIRGLKPKEAIPKAQELLTRVSLQNRVKHRLGELSGGERQRVAIARALVTEPACVLADEPTGNLDHKNAEQIFDLILELNRSLTTAFLIVTHDLKLANRMHRVLTLVNGSLQN
jgi:lipoprotein-releasing system ATP-binding protein